MKDIAKDNHLPDYNIAIDSNDTVTFSQKHSASGQETLSFDDMPRISPRTLTKARQLVIDAGTGWDFNALHEQFTESLLSGFRPEKADGAFINFVKKKTANTP